MNRTYSLLGKASGLLVFCALFTLGYLSVRGLSAEDANRLSFAVGNAGRVYAQAGPGNLAAIDAKAGSVLWNFHDEGLGVFTKAVFSSSSLYVAATRADSNSSELIKLDLVTGTTDWRIPFVSLGGNASPVLCGAEVLLPDYWHKTVSAFNRMTGGNDWKTDSLPFLFLFPPAIRDDNAFFLAADKGDGENKQHLISVSCADGHLGKLLPVRVDGVSRTPVLLYKDSVILSGYEEGQGTSFQAVRASNAEIVWSKSIPDEVTRFSPIIEDNLLVAGAASLWFIDLESGKVAFRESLPKPSVPVAVADGLVFFSRGDRTVEARELPTGKLRWRMKLEGKISSNFAAAEKHVYVKTEADRLAELSIEGEVDRYIQIARPSKAVAVSH
jgi:outer membrane protein assembly factor BamB